MSDELSNLPDGTTPVRWLLSEGFAAHLADLAGVDREDPSEPMEVMGVTAAVLPQSRHWELLIQPRRGPAAGGDRR
jgi:hypothetical protein